MKELPQINTQGPESVYETPDIKPIKPKRKWKSWYRSFVSKLVSSSIHSSALLVALLLFSIEKPGQDYLVSKAEEKQPDLEFMVEFESPSIELMEIDRSYMNYEDLLIRFPETLIDIPDEILNKPMEELTSKDKKYIDEKVMEKINKTHKKGLPLSLEGWLAVESWLLKDKKKDTEDIIEEVREIKELTGSEKDYSPKYSPKNKVSIDKIDLDNMVPHYRITKEPEKWFEAGIVNRKGEYEVKLSKPFYEVDDFEKTKLKKFQKANIPYELKKQVKVLDPKKQELLFYIRTIQQKGEVFQELWVNPDQSYRIATQKPKSKMTIMETVRLKAFELTEGNERHKRYRNIALEYASENVKKEQEAKEQRQKNK